MDPQDANLLMSLSNSMVAAVEKAAASTVMVNARRGIPASGVCYTADLVLTSDHAIEHDDDIKVTMPDGSELKAVLAGRDENSDLAILRLERPVGVPAERAAKDAQVGQFVLALGRPTPEGVQASLGVVSSVGGPVRTRRGGLLNRYLQTDAIPYPGFSGGPLVNAEGQVIGINTSGLTPGASLAIPASAAWETAVSLGKFGRIRRGYLGIRSQPVELSAALQSQIGRSQAHGLLLVGIESNSPSSNAGLMVGDILLGVAGQPVEEHDQLLSYLAGDVIGKPVPLEISRGGQRQTVTVTVGEQK
ncbi:MAG: trypsin-like peptidase domain-containing protein [Anaerolineaceae bacterium]|nr:trypsin-like peptidase domain-containing protein [Anaerolineaceae bacterium]